MKVMVTAGPTREYIDPVRFLSNRSTGKMGYAIAKAFLERGHDVTLISGPVCIAEPEGVSLVNVVSAGDMHRAVKDRFAEVDALVMSAAVADWRPAKVLPMKLKKGGNGLTLELDATADILKDIFSLKGKQIVAGFAAETGDPLIEGRRKLREKGLDLIFCNDITREGAGFECDTNMIVCVERDGNSSEWPMMSKAQAGHKIALIVEELYRLQQ